MTHPYATATLHVAWCTNWTCTRTYAELASTIRHRCRHMSSSPRSYLARETRTCCMHACMHTPYVRTFAMHIRALVARYYYSKSRRTIRRRVVVGVNPAGVGVAPVPPIDRTAYMPRLDRSPMHAIHPAGRISDWSTRTIEHDGKKKKLNTHST